MGYLGLPTGWELRWGQHNDVTAVIFNRGELTGGDHRGADIQVSGNKWLRFLLAWHWPPFALHLGKGSGTDCGSSHFFLILLSVQGGINKQAITENWGLKDYRGPQQTARINKTSFYTLQFASKASNEQIGVWRPAATC